MDLQHEEVSSQVIKALEILQTSKPSCVYIANISPAYYTILNHIPKTYIESFSSRIHIFLYSTSVYNLQTLSSINHTDKKITFSISSKNSYDQYVPLESLHLIFITWSLTDFFDTKENFIFIRDLVYMRKSEIAPGGRVILNISLYVGENFQKLFNLVVDTMKILKDKSMLSEDEFLKFSLDKFTNTINVCYEAIADISQDFYVVEAIVMEKGRVKLDEVGNCQGNDFEKKIKTMLDETVFQCFVNILNEDRKRQEVYLQFVDSFILGVKEKDLEITWEQFLLVLEKI
ncbi:hypothetical protein SteCoe_25811 [Stentor coeruleus]|uniref:Uncharacterized protein n=1 Tax=Stentor coeruleus TaxID=5963 RepID=A0A1R2BED8_9CILI|nr:hypothetical protein SteCoe_25811 [Stentor coeruleus]